MDREDARPEELPPLKLRKLRDLDVEREEGDDRPACIVSASAVVRRGDYAYVIGDDELDLGVFVLSSDEPGEMRRALPDQPSGEGSDGKADKPDVEALTMLPPFEGAPYGALLGLGSGSKRTRDRGFFWELDPRGELVGEATTIDLAPLYEQLRSELEELNVEGAAVLGDRFFVFHRGNASDSQNAIAELSLDEVMKSLTGDHALDVAELERVRLYDLGELGGTRLCFSDATPLSDELVVFTASAEVDDDSAEDGAIRGSVVGTVDAEGGVTRLRTIDRKWKVEGVHASLDTGVIDFVFVCDQDSESDPSPLLSATMPVDAAVERSG